MTANTQFEQETGEKLPLNVEARKMRRGGYSFRVMMPDRTRINLGWNYDEAMARYRELYASPEEESVDCLAKMIHDRHRKGAKSRGIAYELDEPTIARMLRAQRLKCAVTGRRFSLEPLPGVRARPFAPSLDRIKSDQPYTEGNCRLVCAAVNAAIADMGDATFMALFEPLVRRIVQEELAKTVGTMARRAA